MAASLWVFPCCFCLPYLVSEKHQKSLHYCAPAIGCPLSAFSAFHSEGTLRGLFHKISKTLTSGGFQED